MEINHCIICNKETTNHLIRLSGECRNIAQSNTKKKKWADGMYINWTDKRFRDEEKMRTTAMKQSKTKKRMFESREIVNWTDRSIRTPRVQIKIDELNLKRVQTGRKNGMFDWDKTRKLKQSEHLKKVYKNPLLREKIGILVKNSMTPAVKKHISERISEMILSGELKQRMQKGYVRGDYKSTKGRKLSGDHTLFYRSSVELKWFKYLDQNDQVSEWIYEGIRIPLDDLIHNTIVDLDIRYVDGTRKIVEVKAKRMIPYCQNKLSAVKKHCAINNLPFEIWTENEMIEQ